MRATQQEQRFDPLKVLSGKKPERGCHRSGKSEKVSLKKKRVGKSQENCCEISKISYLDLTKNHPSVVIETTRR